MIDDVDTDNTPVVPRFESLAHAAVAFSAARLQKEYGPAATLVHILRDAFPEETVAAWLEALQAPEASAAADAICRLAPYTGGPLYAAAHPLWLWLLDLVPGTTCNTASVVAARHEARVAAIVAELGIGRRPVELPADMGVSVLGDGTTLVVTQDPDHPLRVG